MQLLTLHCAIVYAKINTTVFLQLHHLTYLLASLHKWPASNLATLTKCSQNGPFPPPFLVPGEKKPVPRLRNGSAPPRFGAFPVIVSKCLLFFPLWETTRAFLPDWFGGRETPPLNAAITLYILLLYTSYSISGNALTDRETSSTPVHLPMMELEKKKSLLFLV